MGNLGFQHAKNQTLDWSFTFHRPSLLLGENAGGCKGLDPGPPGSVLGGPGEQGSCKAGSRIVKIPTLLLLPCRGPLAPHLHPLTSIPDFQAQRSPPSQVVQGRSRDPAWPSRAPSASTKVGFYPSSRSFSRRAPWPTSTRSTAPHPLPARRAPPGLEAAPAPALVTSRIDSRPAARLAANG